MSLEMHTRCERCKAALVLSARGTNPDSFRAEDSRFARADVSGRL